MEGNFLSRYNSRINEWLVKIENDPVNKSIHESDMSEYIMQCMPYLKQHTADTDGEVSTDNIFNCKETVGLQRKDIFVDYLIDVEKKNIDRPIPKNIDACPTCPESNIFQFNDTSELVCDNCGKVLEVLLSEELTYKEEQETSEKVINYSYKRSFKNSNSQSR